MYKTFSNLDYFTLQLEFEDLETQENRGKSEFETLVIKCLWSPLAFLPGILYRNSSILFMVGCAENMTYRRPVGCEINVPKNSQKGAAQL